MKITKRNGKVVLYDDEKVMRSILTANKSVPGEDISREKAAFFAGEVFAHLSGDTDVPATQDVREYVYKVLTDAGFPKTAENYRDYRKQGT